MMCKTKQKNYVTNYDYYPLYISSQCVILLYEQEFGSRISTSNCAYSGFTCLEDKSDSSAPGGRIAN